MNMPCNSKCPKQIRFDFRSRWIASAQPLPGPPHQRTLLVDKPVGLQHEPCCCLGQYISMVTPENVHFYCIWACFVDQHVPNRFGLVLRTIPFPRSSWNSQCPCGCGTVVKIYIMTRRSRRRTLHRHKERRGVGQWSFFQNWIIYFLDTLIL